ncbi:MAG: DNA polymerase [Acidobacteriota bacterium]
MSSRSFQLITRPEALELAVADLRAQTVLGFDMETTGLDPHTTRPRLLQLATSETAYLIDLFQLPAGALEPILELLAAEAPIKVAHNAKFDAKFILRHYGVRVAGIFDTYLASQLVSAGSEVDRHSLEAVAQRYLGVQMDKTAQLSDWSGELATYQLEYAASDAATLIPLRENLDARLDEMDLRVTARLEFDCILPIARMELAGVYLQTDLWRAQVERVKASHRRCADLLQEELGRGASQMTLFEGPPQINLDSPQQVRDALARIGIEVEGTSEWRLHGLAREHEVVRRLLEYRGLSKSLSSYGEGILEFINASTGRIHADFRQIGTPTGRMSCSSPSLQQMPHAPEYRSCFRAPEGRRLIIADFSQIEMRILADFSRDPALIAAFKSGADLHRATASEMLSVPLADVTSQQREKAKGLNYGIVYGMGAEGLANRIESTVGEAELLIQRYFRAYPAVDRWLRDAAERAVSEGRSRTASGRLWIFQLDPFDRQQAGQLRRVGKNAPIQGTGSDIFKRAMTLVDEALRDLDARVVNSIHDEIVVECAVEIAESTAGLVSEAMVQAGKEFLPRVPVVVDTVISAAWLKK